MVEGRADEIVLARLWTRFRPGDQNEAEQVSFGRRALQAVREHHAKEAGLKVLEARGSRKQECCSFQEVLDLVPATFSPTCSAGPLFVLTSCFIYNVTLSGRTAFILGYLVLTEICKQKTETITSVNQNYHQVLGFEFGKVKLANKKVKLNNKFLNSILDS